jgi:hypothetical protein
MGIPQLCCQSGLSQQDEGEARKWIELSNRSIQVMRPIVRRDSGLDLHVKKGSTPQEKNYKNRNLRE